MREKENLVSQVSVCKMKQAWLSYEACAEKCKVAKADLEASQE